jgi:hypothetical protein
VTEVQYGSAWSNQPAAPLFIICSSRKRVLSHLGPVLFFKIFFIFIAHTVFNNIIFLIFYISHILNLLSILTIILILLYFEQLTFSLLFSHELPTNLYMYIYIYYFQLLLSNNNMDNMICE